MSHKFNPKHIHKLDNEKRRKTMPPIETLRKLHLEEGSVVADIGCGIGYFSIPAASIVGQNGYVYAVDTNKEMLNELNNRIDNNHKNIKTLQSTEYSAHLTSNIVDYLFLCNVFHEIDDKDKFLNEYLRSLKVEGKIAIIDFKKIESEMGPPLKDRISESELTNILKEHNIDVIELINIGDLHYGLVGKKVS